MYVHVHLLVCVHRTCACACHNTLCTVYNSLSISHSSPGRDSSPFPPSLLSQLALKTVNNARSAYACFLFRRGFFHSYSDGREKARAGVSEEESLKCKITIKVTTFTFSSQAPPRLHPGSTLAPPWLCYFSFLNSMFLHKTRMRNDIR